MANVGTRDKLLRILDDMELIMKELLENLIAPKNQKLSGAEQQQLAELLVSKDQEMKSTLKLASEQAEIQLKIDALQLEVEKQDQEIHQLQRNLKDAEHLLTTAIYQAKQKLQYVRQASEKSVNSEELIKFAHRISASNAVAAPHNWQQGDPRRPYPTDMEMRQGFLGRLSDIPISGNMLPQQQQQLQQPGSLSDLPSARGPHGDQIAASQAGTFSWQPSSDIKSSIGALSLIHI